MSVGSLVGRYRIGAPIGAGGMGVVHEAELASGAPVALKLLHREWMTDDVVVRRFASEAIVGSLVRHPNVAEVIEWGETEQGLPFIVMERVPGEALGLRLERDGAFRPRRAAGIVGQILAGLHAMHSAGVIHGDVKSDNVMLETRADGTDVAKLIDFGLAQAAAPAERPGQGLVAGTPEYMAPEVICGRGSSAGSDLYAVGVIFYELLTGKTPFKGGSAALVVQRHLQEAAVPPSRRASRWIIPGALERVVMRALEKDPRRRFESAAEFAVAIVRAMPAADEWRPVVSPVERPARDLQPTAPWRRVHTGAAGSRRIASGTPAHHLDRHDRDSIRCAAIREEGRRDARDPRP